MVLAQDLLVGVGSLTDCRRLVQLFTSKDGRQLNITNFVKAWREMNFDLIFCGHIDGKEVSQLSGELFSIAKTFTLDSECFAERLGGLYLMYGLYYTQPFNVKVRVSLKEFNGLMDFLAQVKLSNNKEAEFILLKLFVDEAFMFCATPTDHTKLESKQLSHEDEESGLTKQNLVDCCNLIQYGGAYGPQFNQISTKYEEMKKTIPGLSVQLSMDSKINFAAKFISAIKALQDNISKSSNAEQDDDENEEINGDSIPENLDQGEIRNRIRNNAFKNIPSNRNSKQGKTGGRSKS